MRSRLPVSPEEQQLLARAITSLDTRYDLPVKHSAYSPLEEFAEQVIPQWDGTPMIRGLRAPQRQGTYDTPWVARGIGTDYGLLYDLALKSPQWRRITELADQLVLTSKTKWLDGKGKHAELYASIVRSGMRHLSPSLELVIRESVKQLLTAGFSSHVIADDITGGIRRLGLRKPNTIDRWLCDEHGGEIVGVTLRTALGGTYSIPITDCLIVSWTPEGQDIEGHGPLRTAAGWIEAKLTMQQLWQARMAKYAAAMLFIEQAQHSSAAPADEIVEAIDSAEAFDFLVQALQPGQKISVVDLGGQQSEFQALIRYLDEQVLTILAAEAAMLGMSSKGAYNLAEMKDFSEVAIGFATITRTLKAINGENRLPWEGIPQRILCAKLGCDVGDLDEEAIPRLEMVWGEDDVPLEQIIQALQSGLIRDSEELVEMISERLKVPYQRPIADVRPNVEDTALNGAQAAALLTIIEQVKTGAIDVENGIKAAMLTFQIGEDQARALVTPAAGVTPPLDTTGGVP